MVFVSLRDCVVYVGVMGGRCCWYVLMRGQRFRLLHLSLRKQLNRNITRRQLIGNSFPNKQYFISTVYQPTTRRVGPFHDLAPKMSFTTYLNSSKPDIQKAVEVLTSKVASEAASDNLETVLWVTWHDFLDLATSIPHSEQQPLVDFIQALREAADPTKDNGQPYEIWNQDFQWQNLPLFGAQLREELDVGMS